MYTLRDEGKQYFRVFFFFVLLSAFWEQQESEVFQIFLVHSLRLGLLFNVAQRLR